MRLGIGKKLALSRAYIYTSYNPIQLLSSVINVVCSFPEGTSLAAPKHVQVWHSKRLALWMACGCHGVCEVNFSTTRRWNFLAPAIHRAIEFLAVLFQRVMIESLVPSTHWAHSIPSPSWCRTYYRAMASSWHSLRFATTSWLPYVQSGPQSSCLILVTLPATRSTKVAPHAHHILRPSPPVTPGRPAGYSSAELPSPASRAKWSSSRCQSHRSVRGRSTSDRRIQLDSKEKCNNINNTQQWWQLRVIAKGGELFSHFSICWKSSQHLSMQDICTKLSLDWGGLVTWIYTCRKRCTCQSFWGCTCARVTSPKQPPCDVTQSLQSIDR